MEVVTITDGAEWNGTLAALPQAHFLQTWEWGVLKSRYGWQPTRYLWRQGGRARAAALVLTRRTARWLPPVMYVPKGPLLDYADESLAAQVIADLESIARREGAVFIKIDPDVREDAPVGAAVTALLRRRGWLFSREQVQFRNTVLVDLTPPPEEMLRRMKSKWRYNVRLAGRRGVVVRRGGVAALDVLYEMYAETAVRDGFVIRPREYYRAVWGTFIEAGMGHPLLAEVEGEPVAMVFVVHFGRRAWYVYGASRAVHREKMPNHLLQWEAMLLARRLGCMVYDMWGAPEVLDESDPLWGVYRFKRGFGGEFVRHIGAWDYPVSPVGYRLYTLAMPRVLAAMRRVYWWRR